MAKNFVRQLVDELAPLLPDEVDDEVPELLDRLLARWRHLNDDWDGEATWATHAFRVGVSTARERRLVARVLMSTMARDSKARSLPYPYVESRGAWARCDTAPAR